MRFNTLRELRFALRTLTRKPGFSVVVAGTLALAIGGCTIIYSLAYGVLFRPLPYPDPDRIVAVWQAGRSGNHGQFSDPNFEDLRDGSHAFQAIAEHASTTETVRAGDSPVRASVSWVSRQFFDVFQTPVERGRVFSPDELAVGAPRVAVVGHDFWMRVMGGQAIEATPVHVGGETYTVVGVLPPSFGFPVDTAVWMPREQEERNPHRTGHNWQVVARIAQPLDAARRDASAVARRLAAALGDQTAMLDVSLVPLREQLTGSARRPLLVLLAAVACLLVIACANLANLFLAHVTGRRRELAVRSALGAGRAALMLPLFAEIAVLTTIGGLAGIAAGVGGVRGVVALGSAMLPRSGEVAVAWPVVAVSLSATALTAVALSGIVAWSALRADVVTWLKQAQRGQAGSVSSGRVRSVLVVVQLAISVVLLVGAGLLGRSLSMLLVQSPGFRTTQVLTIDLAMPSGTPEQERRRVQFFDRLLERLAALPGVAAAGGVNRFPLGGGYADGTFVKLAGDQRFESFDELRPLYQDPARTGHADYRVASDDYFKAMGIPLKAGRLFDGRDTGEAPHVAVVTESMARTAWPGLDAIGQHVEFGNMDGDLRPFTIVGVVGDIRERGLDSEPRPTLYASYRQRPRQTSGFTLALQTPGDASRLVGPARSAIMALDGEVAPRFRTIDEVFSTSVADRRFNLIVLGSFAGSALLLAMLGIYGVLAYVVSQRTQEFGVRMALGAARRDVWRLVLGQAARLVGLGVALGLVASWMVTRLMSSMLFGITATDPVTFAVVVAGLAATALLACQLPALRATRVDPLTALRAD